MAAFAADGHRTLRNVLCSIAVVCAYCRDVRAAYSAIRSEQKKLGVQERRVLLIAAPPDEPPTAALPRKATQASQVAFRRAVARVCGLGLLEVFPPEARVTGPPSVLRRYQRKYLRPRRVRRTPFGEAVVTAYARELRSGQPLRWLAHGEEARDAALAACPRCG